MRKQAHRYRTRYNQLQSPSVIPRGSWELATHCFLPPDQVFIIQENMRVTSLSSWAVYLQTRSHALRLIPQGYWQNEFPQQTFIVGLCSSWAWAGRVLPFPPIRSTKVLDMDMFMSAIHIYSELHPLHTIGERKNNLGFRSLTTY